MLFGSVTVCGVQVVPFQLSETGVVSGPSTPTATHLVGDVQDTPVRVAELPPPGRGTLWADQLVPFQLSASGA